MPPLCFLSSVVVSVCILVLIALHNTNFSLHLYWGKYQRRQLVPHSCGLDHFCDWACLYCIRRSPQCDSTRKYEPRRNHRGNPRGGRCLTINEVYATNSSCREEQKAFMKMQRMRVRSLCVSLTIESQIGDRRLCCANLSINPSQSRLIIQWVETVREPVICN